jgi:hypothetical protein
LGCQHPKEKCFSINLVWALGEMTMIFSNHKTALQFTRERLGLKRLSMQQRIDVEAAVKRHKERRERAKTSANCAFVPVIDKLKAQIADRLKERLAAEIVKTYNHTTTQWAGGEVFFVFRVNRLPFAWGENRRVWSSNGKWSGTNTEFTINVQPAWQKYIGSVPGLDWAGGMLTTHADRVSEDCWSASWVVQSRGFNLKIDSGYIVKVGDSFYHGKTELAARKVAAKAKVESSMNDRLSQVSTEQLIVEFGSVVVTRSHSLKVNCESGTDNWIARYFPDKDSATVKELLTADGENRAVVAACKVAIRKAAKQLVLA